jgi:hypothetical protein
MRELDDSTLWRISAFEHMREETGTSGFAGLDQRSVLSTTLNADLYQLRHEGRSDDVLVALSACLRHRESALLLLQHRGMVWPLSLFPRQELYHLPRPILPTLAEGRRDLAVISVEPPGMRAPTAATPLAGDTGPGFRPLAPLLWALALHAPHADLLQAVAGRAAYRLAPDFRPDASVLAGALGPALQRLRTEAASLDQIARWPGMDAERAVRLLNGAYLRGGLMVLRHHPAAREAAVARPSPRSWWPLRR